MKHCSFCDKTFTSIISYQIYCSVDCRELATKEKISARYIHTRRQKRVGKDRRCKSCDNVLSIYNDESLCMDCNVNPVEVKKILKKIKGIANGKE
jgi:hypothetical protein